LFTQTRGGAQPLLSAGLQVVTQASFWQRNPWQDMVPPVPLHIPAPSQVLVTTSLPALQVWPHSIPALASLHWPLPSHLPLVPQGSIESLQLSGSAMPFGTSVHMPAAFAQVRQVPQLAVEQQVLSTQKVPAAHSSLLLHWAPSRPLPQLPVPVSQALPLQSASELQVVRHMSLVSHLKLPQLCI
jgi:hypothetical protein